MVVVIFLAATFINFNFLTIIIDNILLPIKSKIYTASNSTKSLFEAHTNINKIRNENKELLLTLERLNYLSTDNKSLKEENEELRNLLQLKERVDYEVIVAQISYIDSLNPYETILIDKGSKDGIKKNMAVTSTEGLLGHITEVKENYSIVELITSTKSYVSSTGKNGDNLSILSGQGNDILDLEYIVKDKDMKVGEEIFTSGVSDIYRKNIFLGTIESIDDSNEMFKQITVKLPYNVFNLKYVMILNKER